MMLVEFKIGNYKSFKDVVSFSMVASAKKEHADTHTFSAPGRLTLLKSSVVYGANASGKSNLFEAIRFMQRFVLTSATQLNVQDEIATDIFRLSSQTENQPSYFQMIFIKDNVRYRYGFQVTSAQVVSEWLFHTTRVRNESLLFRRDGQNIETAASYKVSGDIADKTRKNALFLSVAAQFNGKVAGKILDWFHDLRITADFQLDHCLSTNILESFARTTVVFPDAKNKFLTILREADLGVTDISLTREPIDFESFSPPIRKILEDMKGPKDHTNILFSRPFYNSSNESSGVRQFNLVSDESDGTRKLYNLLGPIIYALGHNIVLIIDEMDAQLHPLVTRFITSLFNTAENTSSQLIFSTHDTSILNKKYLRRDQVWFAEKDQYGATDIYSLDDFNVRNDASFEKDYLLGKYGAIPYIGAVEFDDF